MGKMFKKILCTLLVVLMCLTSAPLEGFVSIEWSNINFGEWFGSKVSALKATGQCGEDVYWSFDESAGELVISGTGPMTDYSHNDYSPLSYSDVIISVVIENGVTTIGEGAFLSCDSLTSVKIGDSVTTIGKGAFESCTNLESITIPDSVTTIGCEAFWYCISLTNVIIPDSVTTIDLMAFSECYSLENITVDTRNTIYSSDSRGCLFDKNKTVIIQYPIGNANTSYIIPDSVNTIGDHAFLCCDSLISITIPDSVTTIGCEAFASCNNISNVSIPGSVEVIGDHAFLCCENLNNINLSFGVTEIGLNVFGGCHSLKNIIIPDSVTEIGDYAFSDCSSLEKVVIGNNVTYIGDGAFYLCNNLKSVSIGRSVSAVRNETFYSCCNLTSIEIPDSVTAIGENAFYNCYNLTNINIPDGVKTIGNGAFMFCRSLISITFPKNVVLIGTKALFRCDSIKSIVVDEDNEHYSSDAAGVLFDKKKETLIQYPASRTKSIYYVPNSVTFIEGEAFNYCGSLEHIVISESVTGIGEFIFSGCYNLTSITVDEDNKNYFTDTDGTLFNKEKSILIRYPIGNSKSSYTIPDCVTVINQGAFSNCLNISSIVIQDTVTTIGNYAFGGCSKLTSITISDSVNIVDLAAFASCGSLNDVYYKGSEEQWNSINIGEENDSLFNATIHYNYSDDTPQIPEHNAKYTIHTFASQPKLIMGYGDAMTMKFELECHNVDAGENFLVSNPTFTFTSSDTDIFTVEDIEKDGQITSARLVSENTGNAILTVGAYANGNLVESLQYLIAVEGEFVYHIDTLINGKGDKDYNFYSYSNGIHVDNMYYVETGGECNLSFDVYNSVNCIAAVEVYSAKGELLATKSVSAFDGTLPTGLWDTAKQMYEFSNKDYSNVSYKDKEYSKKTEVNLYGVPLDGHIKITTDVDDSFACALYNISGLVIDSCMNLLSIAVDVDETSVKINQTITEKILNKIISKEQVKNNFEKIIKNYFQSIKIGSREEIRDSLEEYLIGIESLDINIGEIILEVLKGSGISIVESAISFALGPIKKFVEAIFSVISISKLIDHGVTVEDLRGSKSSAIYFRRYVSAIRYSNGYHINNSEPFPDDVSFHKYKIVSGDTYNIATSKFSDATYIDVISMALYKDGKETQPSGSVQVAIPIPDGMNIFSFKVYRQEADGSFQQLDCDFNNVDNGYIYITTDHFSVYVITAEPIKLTNLHTEQETYTIKLDEGLIPRLILTPDNAYLPEYTLTSSDENIAKVTDSGLIIGVSHGNATVTVTCQEITTEFEVIVEPDKHILNSDGICEKCGVDVTEDCSCRCHKDNFFARIIWNIINFFNKLFKKNAVCDCGMAHY